MVGCKNCMFISVDINIFLEVIENEIKILIGVEVVVVLLKLDVVCGVVLVCFYSGIFLFEVLVEIVNLGLFIFIW